MAWLDGKTPCSWKSSMTSCLLVSRVLRRVFGLLSAVLGVTGELTLLMFSSRSWSWETLNDSGLKSGPKKVFPCRFARLADDIGPGPGVDVMATVTGVLGVRGVRGVALASDPRSSSVTESFLFFL